MPSDLQRSPCELCAADVLMWPLFGHWRIVLARRHGQLMREHHWGLVSGFHEQPSFVYRGPFMVCPPAVSPALISERERDAWTAWARAVAQFDRELALPPRLGESLMDGMRAGGWDEDRQLLAGWLFDKIGRCVQACEPKAHEHDKHVGRVL